MDITDKSLLGMWLKDAIYLTSLQDAQSSSKKLMDSIAHLIYMNVAQQDATMGVEERASKTAAAGEQIPMPADLTKGQKAVLKDIYSRESVYRQRTWSNIKGHIDDVLLSTGQTTELKTKWGLVYTYAPDNADILSLITQKLNDLKIDNQNVRSDVLKKIVETGKRELENLPFLLKEAKPKQLPPDLSANVGHLSAIAGGEQEKVLEALIFANNDIITAGEWLCKNVIMPNLHRVPPRSREDSVPILPEDSHQSEKMLKGEDS
jgi:hypothetical protein